MARIRLVLSFSSALLANLSPDALHQAKVNPLPEQACWSGWGQVFSSSVLQCTQPAASSSCLVLLFI